MFSLKIRDKTSNASFLEVLNFILHPHHANRPYIISSKQKRRKEYQHKNLKEFHFLNLSNRNRYAWFQSGLKLKLKKQEGV